MGNCFLHGNGVATDSIPFNFKVVGGTTAPTEPTENMVWVNTEHEITGFIIDVIEPYRLTNRQTTENGVTTVVQEKYIPADWEGHVWIKTSDSSKICFNALKENLIEVRPLYAKQVVNGKFVEVIAQIYLKDAWNDWWNGCFFRDGVFFSEYENTQKISPSTAVITQPFNSIQLETAEGKTSEVYIVIGPVNMDQYTELSFEGLHMGGDTVPFWRSTTIFVSKTAGDSYKNAVAIGTELKNNINANTPYNVSVNVANLHGDHYIHAGLNTAGEAWSGKRGISINTIRGERK